MANIEVVGLGALNIDHIYQVERILDDGETVVNEIVSSPGGSAANTIYGLAKLGISTGFIGVVGDDAGGKIILQNFQKVGVDTSQVRVKSGAKTGAALCLSDKLGKRSLYILPGANNRLSIDDIDLSYINQARRLHLSSFVDDRQCKVLLTLMAKLEPSIEISFSPGALYAAKGLDALSTILARTNVLFLNKREIEQLTDKEVITGAKSCLKQGCQIIAVTLGQGTVLTMGRDTGHRTVTATSYIRDAENEYAIEPASQNVGAAIDTTGAGDAFATGFIYGLLNGKGLKQCGLLGDVVAQYAVSKIGAREGLPTITQLAQG